MSLREYRADEVFGFVEGLLEELEDEKFDKYKKKLYNCYLNNSLCLIQNDEADIKSRFIALVSMVAFIENADPSYNTKAVAKMTEEIKEYLMQKEISRIRRIILDSKPCNYTEDTEYSIKPEAWAMQVTKELEHVLPQTEHPGIEKVLQSISGSILVMLLKEIKEIFVSKQGKFGKKANALVVNLIHIEAFFSRHTDVSEVESVIEQVQSMIQSPESTEKLRAYQIR